jgi:hypothetical protein
MLYLAGNSKRFLVVARNPRRTTGSGPRSRLGYGVRTLYVSMTRASTSTA